MNKSALIKIVGILVGSFVVITILTFFLYPYLNEEKYEQVQEERAERLPTGEFEGAGSDTDLFDTENADLNNDSVFSETVDSLALKDSLRFAAIIDSLTAANDSLTQELESANSSLANLEQALMEAGADRDLLASAKSGSGETPFVTVAEEPQEEFSERVKSLLNLDEEDLTPIASQMTQQELVKIYQTSSNLQREKLLRSLTPERAAKLMQEIML